MTDEILIREKFIPLFQQLSGNEKGGWGKMNAWQAVEHLTEFFNASSHKVKYDIVTSAEYLPKYKEFLQSDKEFRENTKAPESIIGEEPRPTTAAGYPQALEGLQVAVNDFFKYFENNANALSIHPVFGQLNFAEWLRLHGKHVRHHLRQFSLLS